MIELLAQLTAAYMGTFMTVMLASYAPILIIAQCAKKTPEPHGVYKPGHLPTFVDPESKEADTYYSMKSEVAFPKKDKDGNVIPEGQYHKPKNTNISLRQKMSTIGQHVLQKIT
ncbi:unnamed protein product [Toxocara canis]|uniref:NADH-ubiquinone oxidoreductase MWFE subunit n=1 Tax=Toxocara canis TaxID=6265 RepID=A0A183UWC4_TOXCA|nr:unnamed protein product [Toxocara canis]